MSNSKTTSKWGGPSTPEITEDLTEAQLAEIAFGTEVMVYWEDHNGVRQHGIIVGYEDPTKSRPVGSFMVDVVEKAYRAGGQRAEPGWHETGDTVQLDRDAFTVFGPANRDPGDREVDVSPEGWDVIHKTPSTLEINEDMTASDLRRVVSDGDPLVLVSYEGRSKFGIVGEDFKVDTFPIRRLTGRFGRLTDEWVHLDRHHFVVLGPITDAELAKRETPSHAEADIMAADGVFLPNVSIGLEAVPFLGALVALVGAKQTDTGLPAFEVRLDVKCPDDKDPEMRRSYRILVRPTMQPMMDDEIETVMSIAHDYALAVQMSNAGLEVVRADDMSDYE